MNRPPEITQDNWHISASCASADPEAFFPADSEGIRKAKKVCNECPVSLWCRKSALDKDEEYGIWGGMTHEERKNYLLQQSTEGVRRESE